MTLEPWLRVKVRVFTPMLISGADPSQAEIRVPSIKGALRFWYRAILGARYQGDLEQIRIRESLLFGSTAHQSPIQLSVNRLSNPLKPVSLKGSGLIREFSNLPYLLFPFRPTNEEKSSNSEKSYSYFEDTNTFTIDVWMFHNRIKEFLIKHKIEISEEKLKEDFLAALWMWSQFGGLGKRTRRGFGSIVVENSEEVFPQSWSIGTARSLVELKSNIQLVMGKILSIEQGKIARSSTLPDFPYLSENSRLVLQQADSPEQAFQITQTALQSLGVFTGTKSFKDKPHLLAKLPIKQRYLLGLPKQLQLKKTKYSTARRVSPLEKQEPEYDKARHASPLFITIKPLQQGKFVILYLLLPNKIKILPNSPKQLLETYKQLINQLRLPEIGRKQPLEEVNLDEFFFTASRQLGR